MNHCSVEPRPIQVVTAFPSEIKALLLAARTRLDPQSIEALQELLSRSFDWPRLLHLAHVNGVTPLLHQTLQQLDHSVIPKDVLEKLSTEVNVRIFKNLMRLQELLQILDGMTQAGILAIPLKGPVLAQTVYGNVALRIFADLDVWVPQSQIQAAEKFLVEHDFELCYRLQWERLFHRPQTGLDIDLHQAITSHKFPFLLSLEVVTKRLQTLTLAGHAFKILSPEDTLLVQCAGWCKDTWGRSSRLSQLCDVAEILRSSRQLDWDYLVSQSDRLDAYNILLLPLVLAYEWLAAPLPEHILKRALDSPAIIELKLYSSKQFWLYAANPTSVPETIAICDHRFYFSLRPGLMSRLKYLLTVILTPTEKEKQLIELPPGFAWIYVIVRFIRLFNKYARYGISQIRQKVAL